MKTINKIKYALLALAVLCLSFAFLGFNIANAQQEYKFELSSNLKDKYVVGEVVEIPTALYAGEEADFVIKLPNGAFSNAKNLELTQYGAYTVEYSAKNPVSNEVVKYAVSFCVYAVSEGMVVVGAKLDDGSTAKCFVIVTDNELVPYLSMNILV